MKLPALVTLFVLGALALPPAHAAAWQGQGAPTTVCVPDLVDEGPVKAGSGCATSSLSHVITSCASDAGEWTCAVDFVLALNVQGVGTCGTVGSQVTAVAFACSGGAPSQDARLGHEKYVVPQGQDLREVHVTGTVCAYYGLLAPAQQCKDWTYSFVVPGEEAWSASAAPPSYAIANLLGLVDEALAKVHHETGIVIHRPDVPPIGP